MKIFLCRQYKLAPRSAWVLFIWMAWSLKNYFCLNREKESRSDQGAFTAQCSLPIFIEQRHIACEPVNQLKILIS